MVTVPQSSQAREETQSGQAKITLVVGGEGFLPTGRMSELSPGRSGLFQVQDAGGYRHFRFTGVGARPSPTLCTGALSRTSL